MLVDERCANDLGESRKLEPKEAESPRRGDDAIREVGTVAVVVGVAGARRAG
jgi:hypothetical protein